MKKYLFVLLSLFLLAFTSYAIAEKPGDKGCGPPDDKPGGKPGKVTLLHCGCDWDGVDPSMGYKEITVSSKSKGHFKHEVGTIDSCYAGQNEVEPGVFEDIYVDFVRLGGDCQLSGDPIGEPILDCAGYDPVPIAGDPCGGPAIN